ncbi:MAG: hypothetical protein WCP61_02235 [Chitinophagia bacterium]
MIASYRKKFNNDFAEVKYQQYLKYLDDAYPNALDFRVAETPVFINETFKKQLLEVGDYISDQILKVNFKTNTNTALNNQAKTPNEPNLPECLVMDFALSYNEQNEIVPALIELQGFPSLFAFEVFQDEAIRNCYVIDEKITPYLNGYDKAKYISHLTKIIKGKKNEHTVLLEIQPHQQKTRVDFYCTEHYLDIPIVCITELFQKGSQLFYHRNGLDIKIDRIYNRIVSDELQKQSEIIQEKGKILQQELQITWVNHPHHFFRISKYLLPFLNHTFIPKTEFLSQIKSIPSDLQNYVLKPLFSFAGQGVIIDIQPDDIEGINDPENWIIQNKVHYAECIETPTGPAKAEIRLFYFWDELNQKYIATLNLARLSKGKMIGVQYNNNANWVGGSLAYFVSE